MRGPMTVAILGLIGCGSTSSEEPAEPAQAPAAAPVAEGAPHGPNDGHGHAAAADPNAIHRVAKVVETLEGGGYTYAKLDACGQEAWAAGPNTVLEPGTVVGMPKGMAMEGFESPTLGRTFDAILFVDWFREVDESRIDCSKADKPAMDSLHGGPPGGGEARLPKEKKFFGKAVETMVSGGYTYVQLDQCGETLWLAGPQIPVKKGQFVVSPDGMEMKDFTSKTLDHTFESLWFVSSFAISPTPPPCK